MLFCFLSPLALHTTGASPSKVRRHTSQRFAPEKPFVKDRIRGEMAGELPTPRQTACFDLRSPMTPVQRWAIESGRLVLPRGSGAIHRSHVSPGWQ